MARPFVERIIAKKTDRLAELVKGGMDLRTAKYKVLDEREHVDYEAVETIRRRILQTSLQDLEPKTKEAPKSFWSRLFGL